MIAATVVISHVKAPVWEPAPLHVRVALCQVVMVIVPVPVLRVVHPHVAPHVAPHVVEVVVRVVQVAVLVTIVQEVVPVVVRVLVVAIVAAVVAVDARVDVVRPRRPPVAVAPRPA